MPDAELTRLKTLRSEIDARILELAENGVTSVEFEGRRLSLIDLSILNKESNRLSSQINDRLVRQSGNGNSWRFGSSIKVALEPVRRYP